VRLNDGLRFIALRFYTLQFHALPDKKRAAIAKQILDAAKRLIIKTTFLVSALFVVTN